VTNIIRVPAEQSALPRVWEYVDGLLENVSEKTRNEIRLAVEEIFVNIADYAYEGQAGDVTVTVSLSSTCAEKETETFFVTFADRGKPFNPLLVTAPDIFASPEEREKGGFGIYMVKNLMDVIEYKREDGWNKLTIGKHIRRSGT
jgi:anti-sigma regulatory factor (Ser/Thr protein kinase)